MDLNEQIALQASSLLAGSIFRGNSINDENIQYAVSLSNKIWLEVLKQEREGRLGG